MLLSVWGNISSYNMKFKSNKCKSGTTIEAERTSFVRYIEVENIPSDDAGYLEQLYGPASRFHYFV